MAVNSTIQEIVKAEWPAVERQLSHPPQQLDPLSPPLMQADDIGWNYRLTPGFPSLWPCPPNGELIYYAWASGLQPESRLLFEECLLVLSRQVGPLDHAWIDRAKRSYRFWIKCNGVIARQIRHTHDLFFAWIESEPQYFFRAAKNLNVLRAMASALVVRKGLGSTRLSFNKHYRQAASIKAAPH